MKTEMPECPLLKSRRRQQLQPTGLPRLHGRILATFLAFGMGLMATATLVTVLA